VLVLLAAHNGEKWIAEQLESILNQVEVDVRVVVSDDSSSDETRGRVSVLAGDSRVTIVSPSGPTGSAARNFIWLICNASTDACDYVALADQDDIWHEEKLVRAVSALQTHGSAGYSCAVTAFWKHGPEKSKVLNQSPTPTALDFMFEGAGQGCTFVLQQDFFLRIQRFFRSHAIQVRELHYHDWAIYALARSWRLRWHFDPQPLVHYRQHDRNDTGARSTRGGVGKRLRLIRSGWYRRQMIAIAAICAIAAPEDMNIARWNRLVAETPSFVRRIKIACICIAGGRRRPLDNWILLAAVLGGYV